MTVASGWRGKAAGWLRAGRGGLFLLALLVGAGSGLGAVAFRYLIYFCTWLATGHDEFGQQGRVASAHLSWLGPAFYVLIPVIGGLVYGPLIYRYAREARGQREAHDESDTHETRGFAGDHAKDTRRRSAERDTNSDLVRPLSDAERDDAVDPDQ